MQSQLKSYDEIGAPAAKSRNWWLEVRRAKAPVALHAVAAEGASLRRAPAAQQALSVDLSYPPDRLAQAAEVLEHLEAEGYRVSTEQTDWLPEGSKAVMIWWQAGAEDQAKALFARLRQVADLEVRLAASPAAERMCGDIQIALGREA